MGSASVATVALSLSLLLLPALGHSAELRDHLYGVRALSATEAWAVGNFGTIEHTTDGGATWKSVDAEIRRPIFGIDFGDPQHAWAVGKSALVLRTEDGGKTWKQQSTPLSVEKHLFKVKALDNDTAWAVGDWGTIITTHDGGATWQDRSLSVVGIKSEEVPGRTTTTLTDDVILYDVSFPDRDHGVISGEFGTVLFTSDGGATWTHRPTPTDKTLFGVYFATPERGWVVGIDGLLMRTDDGGHTWTRRELPDRDRLVWMRDVSLAPGAGGFAVGANGFDARVDREEVILSDGRRAATAAD